MTEQFDSDARIVSQFRENVFGPPIGRPLIETSDGESLSGYVDGDLIHYPSTSSPAQDPMHGVPALSFTCESAGERGDISEIEEPDYPEYEKNYGAF